MSLSLSEFGPAGEADSTYRQLFLCDERRIPSACMANTSEGVTHVSMEIHR